MDDCHCKRDEAADSSVHSQLIGAGFVFVLKVIAMRRRLLSSFRYLTFIMGLVICGAAIAQQDARSSGPAARWIGAGTKVEMAVIRPQWAKTAAVGDAVYAQTIFPVIGDGRIAIPAGSYVLGKVLALTKPTRRNNHAEIQVEFDQLSLANGYTVELKQAGVVPASKLIVQVAPWNDLLLDNGAQIEMILPSAIGVDPVRVAQAIPLSRPPVPGSFVSATTCRYVPGTQGTADTTIPGTPGTPPTVIPGGPGMPPTVIPGTPGTSPTTIHGSPGSPGVRCPAAPLVVSSDSLVALPTSPASSPSSLR
jgi:hypothetical protein